VAYKNKRIPRKNWREEYKKEVEKELKDLEEKYKVINRLQNEGIKMLLSPDASSKYMMTGCNMVSEMDLLKKANLTNFEILQMTTSNFSDFFKENYGVLKTGKDADFIILDENPLENLQTIKQVKGLYYNQIFISETELTALKSKLLETTEKK